MAKGKKLTPVEMGGAAQRVEKRQPDGRFRLYAQWALLVGGGKRGTKTKHFGYVGTPAAEAEFDKFMAQMAERPQAGEWTVGAWAMHYLDGPPNEELLAPEKRKSLWSRIRLAGDDRRGTVAKATYTNQETVIRLHLGVTRDDRGRCSYTTTLAAMPLHAVEAGHIVEWADGLRVGDGMVQNCLSTISNVFRAAVRPPHKILNVTPCVELRRMMGLKSKRAGYTVKNLEFSQLKALVAAAREIENGAPTPRRKVYPTEQTPKTRVYRKRMIHPRPSYYALVAAGIGARPGEMFGLMWTDFIAADYARVRVERQVACGDRELTEPKAGAKSAHEVDVLDFAREALRAERQRQREAAFREGRTPSLYVLGVEPQDAPAAKGRTRRILQLAAKRAGLGDIGFNITLHTHRHTFAANHTLAGTTRDKLQLQMGHLHPSTTDVYGRPRPRPQPGAAAAVSAAYEAADGDHEQKRSGTAD